MTTTIGGSANDHHIVEPGHHGRPWRHPTAYSCWGTEEGVAIERVLLSGRFTMGAEVKAFEEEFAAWHGRAHGIMVNSGSSANLVATAALFHVKQRRALRRGDVAIVPALAWSTTYAPLVQYGLHLVLSDCDDTWNAAGLPDSGVYADIAQDAKLVVVCSILGNPAHVREWKEWADLRGALVLEDNCESLGAVAEPIPGHPTKLCGTIGIASTFSFFYSHQLSAIEGGMILTDDDEVAILCRMLRAHGWTRDVSPPLDFNSEYDFRMMGYNVRPVEMHAAIARAQLQKLGAFVEQRRKNAALFARLALDAELPIKLAEPNGEESPFGVQFEILSTVNRSDVAAALRGVGIDCRLPTGGSLRQHAYGEPWRDMLTPRADRIHRLGMFLGNGPLDLSPEMERAVVALKEALRA